ncbi:MAG TPA: isocitrate lyase/phosphoenolpyruvate mutase family protein [Candidatus Acidoferrales bacterium]|nr:isocitrate lyase/phosphoenolpyruvate mutase family protein [Candidatus Acidoferrales bacterium]
MTKGERFRALHERDRAFVIPNPFDIGTAKLMKVLGFEAIATTSAGFAYTIGKPDGAVDLDAMLAHCQQLVEATDLPVSADLENGYADEPERVAETVRRAAAAGLAGCSIEDLPLGRGAAQYPIEFAAQRVAAAAAAARALPSAFTLTARAENFIAGNPDLGDAVARLNAYAEAGADVIYAPGITTRHQIAAVVAVGRPVNVLAGLAGMDLRVDDLSALGVKRISVGSALSRSALDAVVRAAREMRDQGSFTFASEALRYAEVNEIFAG